MKKVLIFNPFAGAAGDMILGALVDLGVSLEYIKSELKKVDFTGYEILESNVTRRSLAAKRVDVKLEETTPSRYDRENSPRPSSGPSDHLLPRSGRRGKGRDPLPSLVKEGRTTPHTHSKDSYTEDHHTREGYRTWKEIRLMIKDSRLNASVKRMALKAFELLARAEAKAHGVLVSDVHFHEVGATDSLVDMIGTCIAVDYLKPDRIISTPVSVGSGGFVDCSHGRMPVPTPATLNILKGLPIRPQPVEMELCTPTGAALLVSFSDGFKDLPKDIKIIRTGTGAGSREGAGDLPGIFRAMIVEEI